MMYLLFIFSGLAVLAGILHIRSHRKHGKGLRSNNLDMSLGSLVIALALGALCVAALQVQPVVASLTGHHQVIAEATALEEETDSQPTLQLEPEEDAFEHGHHGNQYGLGKGQNPTQAPPVVEPSVVEEPVQETPVQEAPAAPAATVADPTPQQTEATVVESTYKDGVYQGTGRGYKSNITVEVEVANGLISRVEVVEERDDRRWFQRANNVIPSSIIAAQSADVDTVSGATYSSLGIINGAAEAIDQSRGE